MPAITLGLAEVEERLRRVRRRLNSFTILHAAFLSLSTILLAIAALVFFGLRGSAPGFRVAMWCIVAIAMAVSAGSWLHAWRRWLDIGAAAHVVDQRGRLTDRVATLLDLRLRPRPSRLAPVLVAQALALGAQWRPERIGPRRIPHSVYLLAAALLALGTTPLIAPEPPPPAKTAAVAGRGSVALDGSMALTEQQGKGGATTEAPSGKLDASRLPVSPPQPNGMLDAAGSAAKEPSDPAAADNLLGVLPDKLRRALLSAFHAEPMDGPRQLSARSDEGGERGDDRRSDSDRDGPNNAGKREPPPLGSKNGAPSEAQQRPPKQSGAGHTDEAAAQPHNPQNPDSRFDGSSPAAGDGSSPTGLMDPKGAGRVVIGDGPKTFKLTITSFLRAVEQKGSQPRQQAKHANTAGVAASGEAVPAALNDRQLNDDALRKAEIPPEYEDIVRRVYSAKAVE